MAAVAEVPTKVRQLIEVIAFQPVFDAAHGRQTIELALLEGRLTEWFVHRRGSAAALDDVSLVIPPASP